MKRNPKDMERALRTIASGQAGYFTSAQARSVGYDYPQQHFHRQRGNWEQLGRGIFRFPDFPGSKFEHYVLWQLWSRNRSGRIQAVASHETACVIYDISDLMPAKMHFTVPPTFRKKPPGGLVMHRAVLDPKEITEREGVLVTTPIRTIRDIAESQVGVEHLDAVVRDALHHGLVLRAQLLDARLSPVARERMLTALLKLGEHAA